MDRERKNVNRTAHRLFMAYQLLDARARRANPVLPDTTDANLAEARKLAPALWEWALGKYGSAFHAGRQITRLCTPEHVTEVWDILEV